jgi:hypothetical protein
VGTLRFAHPTASFLEMSMPVNMTEWRTVIEQVVRGLADKEMQQRAWFGIGPEVSSPDEVFNQFFGDAAIEEFLVRGDTGLNVVQIQAGRELLKLMKDLSDQTPDHIEPSDLLDDPRWERVREAATRFVALLTI